MILASNNLTFNNLYSLNLENEYCNKFNISEINKLLYGYDKKCEELLINIFEIVLINSIGRIICQKDLKSLNINKLDRLYIKNKLEKLSLEELEEELVIDAKICCESLEIKNEDLKGYIKKALSPLALLINERVKIDKLDKVFISFDSDNNESVKYVDSRKMSNSQFKKLSEEIRGCSCAEDKIKLIKDNIKSLEDLFDMLNADCLFNEEYNIYFKSLSKMEIVLLSKYMEENYSEKELKTLFNDYMLSLSKEEQIEINKLKEKITDIC